MLSIVIPTYNGLHLLRESLPSVLKASEHFQRETGGEFEVLVVDDGSDDDTPRAIAEEFRGVEVIERPVNGGFAPACNTGFQRCRHPVVALLNNDVRVEKAYFQQLAAHFQDAPPDLFAVTARVFEWNDPVFATGGKVGRFRKGFWSVYFNYDVDLGSASDWVARRGLLSFYAVGGFAAFDRQKLLELGGFLEVLSPFHWEDIDLSYRGWKRGWKVRYEPRAVAFHRDSATIDAHYRKKEVEAAAMRNRLLFHWINCHQASFLWRHFAMLKLLFFSRIWVGDTTFYRALWGALRRFPEALRLRGREARRRKRSDSEVERLLTEFYRSAPIHVYYNRRQVVEEHPGR